MPGAPPRADWQDLLELALAEDVGAGDLTSALVIDAERVGRGRIEAREPLVVCGLEIAETVFRRVDPSLTIERAPEMADGRQTRAGDVLMRIHGRYASILTAERTALNFLQRLSGVATLTAKHADLVKGTSARILDTRKTTPGYRLLEKQAVLDGGGTNHRLGLYDRAMVKDNHLVAEGGAESIQAAITKLKADKPGVEVELEADNLKQVRVFLEMEGVDHILLDNMSLDDMREAVEARGNRGTPLLEASGGVSLDTLRGIAETGVDFISVGALTHSAPALDCGLDFVPL